MLAPGTRIGPYSLGPEVGRGASGVVYEARDEQLGRLVALKVLSDDVSRTAEQRARFAREARLLAAISHPNIATVYGVVEERERVFLAMEYLEGETLAEALERGPLPIEDALDVARQIADGLEAAHESGVIHRDLKPANAVRALDGTVKVLDFGLAKPAGPELSDSSELSSDGLVLGTPLYMSPEQLRGRPVDRRADVWAFGCVLWELLTGARAFGGETTADVLHAILEHDPDPARLPANTPPRVRELLSRCLQKDARRRLRDIGDARLELEAALAERAWVRGSSAEAATQANGSSRRALPAPIVAALAVAAGLLGLWIGSRWLARGLEPRRVLRLALDVAPGDKQTYPRVSPDGATLIHELAKDTRPEGRRLVARRLDSFDDEPIPGTERVDTYAFSPDGERLAVVRVSVASSGRYELVLVRLDGSEPPTFLAALPPHLSSDGATAWLDDGRIVLATKPRGLLLVHTDGSGRMDEVPVDCDRERWPQSPRILGSIAGTRFVLAVSLQFSGRSVVDCIVAIDIDTGEQTVVVENSSHAIWQPTGHLLFSRSDVLLAAPFDLDALAIRGDPVPIASGLRTESVWTSGAFDASRDGTLVWMPGGVVGGQRRISWIEGSQDPRPWSEDAFALEGFLNVDGTGSFLTSIVVSPSGNYEIWGSEIRAPRLRPLLADPRYDFRGACVSLARRELFFCRFGESGGEVRRTLLDDPGDGELLHGDATEGVYFHTPALVGDSTLTVTRRTVEGFDFMVFDLSAPQPSEPQTLFVASTSTRYVGLSHDGRWLSVTDRDVPPALRRVHANGTLGPPRTVPTAGLEHPGAWWAREQTAGVYRLHLMPSGSRSVYEVEAREVDDAGLEFTAPRLVIELSEGKFFDATHVGGDRYLGVVMGADENAKDTIHVMIGGLDELTDD